MQFTQQFGVETKMNICRKSNKIIETKVKFNKGCLYKSTNNSLYLCTRIDMFSNGLVNIETGHLIKDLSNLAYKYTDVTDQYCLQEK